MSNNSFVEVCIKNGKAIIVCFALLAASLFPNDAIASRIAQNITVCIHVPSLQDIVDKYDVIFYGGVDSNACQSTNKVGCFISRDTPSATFHITERLKGIPSGSKNIQLFLPPNFMSVPIGDFLVAGIYKNSHLELAFPDHECRDEIEIANYLRSPEYEIRIILTAIYKAFLIIGVI